jgi:hypothetical protein
MLSKKELLILSIIIFLSVIAWLIADIQHAVTESKIKIKEEPPAFTQFKINNDILMILKEKKR